MVQNIMWYDLETGKVKLTKHARFDEGMNDLPFKDIPPNVQHLTRIRRGECPPEEMEDSMIDQFTFTSNPFAHTLSKKLKVRDRDSTFGITLDTDGLYNRAFVKSWVKNGSAHHMFSTDKAANNALKGAFIIKIDGERVFTEDDVRRVFKRLHDEQASEFEIELSQERKLATRQVTDALLEHGYSLQDHTTTDDEEHIPILSIEDVRTIASHLFPDEDFGPEAISADEISLIINALSSKAMTNEEAALGAFSCHHLKKLSTWPEWQEGEFHQLDRFHWLQMYGAPVK